jgi:hypothetical protein
LQDGPDRRLTQIQQDSLPEWARMTVSYPAASAILKLLIHHMEDQNGVMIYLLPIVHLWLQKYFSFKGTQEQLKVNLAQFVPKNVDPYLAYKLRSFST